MKLRYLAIFMVIVLVFGAFVLVTNSKNTNQEQLLPAKEISPTAGGTSGETIKSDKYVSYIKNILENNSDKKRVLFFYASWCPTCRPADANFQKNEDKIPDDVIVIRVNYNDPETDEKEKELANKYAVTYQHTFVQIDKEGNEIVKWNGGQIEELLNNVR